jgi:hypothetical protein
MTTSRSVLFCMTVASAAAFTGCTNEMPAPEPVEVDRVGLLPFASCDDVLEFVHEEALEKVGPYGFQSEGSFWGEGDAAGEDGGGDTGAAGDSGGGDDGGGAQGGGDAPEFSGTNVQELGVDEPDLVKTDGTRILAIAQGRLHYVDLSGDAPAVTGSVQLLEIDPEYGWYGGNEMLVHGDRAVVIARRSAWDLGADLRAALGYGDEDWSSITQLIEIDLSDATAPRVVGNLWLEGDYVSGRKIDATARFVLRSFPRNLRFKSPWDFLDEGDISYDEYGYEGYDEEAYAAAERQATAHNQAIVRATALEHWMPRAVIEDPASGEPTVVRLVDCERAFEPGTFAGLGMLSVLTVDMARPLALGDAVGVFSEGETVYASQDSLYVATWPQYLNLPDGEPDRVGEEEQPDPSIVSYVHKFDIRDPEKAEYRASGEVPGHLLDQWAMSEHEGDLRVASTDWGWWSEGSQSFVSVLRERGRSLELVGQVGGIGRDEQIFGVRFIGPTGYVVTFRQTDPLFTVDLRNPEEPTVVGELHIPGYSAYLHPLAPGILLGVGRDGDEEGNLGGAALSIFDVSDPAQPLRLHQAAFGDGWASSTVEWDHRAFLYWAPEKIVVVPVTSWGEWDEETQTQDYFAGAVAYRVDPELGISLAGIIEHDPLTEDEWGWSWGGEIQRSLVVGEDLFTMSESGLKSSTMDAMVETGWLPFAN